MKNISKEDYLSAIYKNRDSDGTIKGNQIAEKLEISNAAVTDMLKKLSKDGYVDYKRYQGIKLTGEGEEYATLRDEVFFTTSNVVDLVPDSSRTAFAVGKKVYVFAALRAPRDERVKVTWYSPEGREILPSAYFDVEPNLGAIGFRIFSYRTFRKPGDYRVAVFNSAGRMIGESEFIVK